MPINFTYPNLITLNSQELTDESRKPLQEDRDERSVDVVLASGKRRKYIKAVKKKWTVSWDNVALNKDWTVDGFGGRNEIRALAAEGGPFTLGISDGRNADESYTVFVDNYSETLLMRHGEGDQFRYTLSLTMSEQ